MTRQVGIYSLLGGLRTTEHKLALRPLPPRNQQARATSTLKASEKALKNHYHTYHEKSSETDFTPTQCVVGTTSVHSWQNPVEPGNVVGNANCHATGRDDITPSTRTAS